MAQFKKISISLPDTLADKIDALALQEGKTRDALICDILENYSQKRKRSDIEQELADGYRAMASLNREWAELCLNADNCQQQHYEENLSESE